MNNSEKYRSILLSALAAPRTMTSPAPWSGHTPFAMWLIKLMQPRLLVELGAYSGISYLSFCQAVDAAGLNTRCYAVDTWQGDEHAGFYGEHIYQTLRKNHDPYYSSFSILLRKTFDEALSDFLDASIDILHIDGLHAYEAVRHDFESWLPKISDRGIVLFHDMEVRFSDFGVWKYWEEVRKQYPGFSFAHSHGLGVLFVGDKSLEPWLEIGIDPRVPESIQDTKRILRALGAAQEYRSELHAVDYQLKELQTDYQSKTHALESKLHDSESNLHNVKSKMHELELHLQNMNHIVSQNTLHEKSLKSELDGLEKRIAQKDEILHHLNSEMQRTIDYRFKKAVQKIIESPKKIGNKSIKVLHRTRNAARYIARGDFAALSARLKGLWNNRLLDEIKFNEGKGGNFGIITTQHTLYVAHAIEQALKNLGLSSKIILNDDAHSYDSDFYIVLCAQMFKNLPPGEKRIVFQMEQTISDRWFDKRYLKILEESRAVIDYSLANLSYLAEKGIVYPHVFHVPLGAVLDYKNIYEIAPASNSETDEYDVLFYGDANAPRRQEYLIELKKHFRVKVINNLFGKELQSVIASSRVIVNIHYYEGALLESTRIFECLSLGARVVSESAVDVADYPGLEGQVRFVPVGDIAAMVDSIKKFLCDDVVAQDNSLSSYLQNSQNRFNFMLHRVLLAQRLISFQQFQDAVCPPSGDAFVLSLPETQARRAAYMENPVPGVQVFDGLRARPGWIGCAMGYKYLCSTALKNGSEQLLICEDDVEFPPNYDEALNNILGYLEEIKGQWDIFVGIIADLHSDAKILDVQERNGLTFVTLDKMTSMVFNIYSRNAMKIISDWDEKIIDDQRNTIDRYLESTSNIRVVTVLEPIFGHREDVQSSLWGFGNEQYMTHILKSRAKLREKVMNFQKMRSM